MRGSGVRPRMLWSTVIKDNEGVSRGEAKDDEINSEGKREIKDCKVNGEVKGEVEV